MLTVFYYKCFFLVHIVYIGMCYLSTFVQKQHSSIRRIHIFSHMDVGPNMQIVCVWNCVGYACLPGKFTSENERKRRSNKFDTCPAEGT